MPMPTRCLPGDKFMLFCRKPGNFSGRSVRNGLWTCAARSPGAAFPCGAALAGQVPPRKPKVVSRR